MLPAADADRAESFYTSLGRREDADFSASEHFRLVPMTPPGSAASVIFGSRVTSATPGSVDRLQLVVDGVEAARAELAGHGVGVGEVLHNAGGVLYHAGATSLIAGPATDHKSYCSWASFNNLDANNWNVQEQTTRLPGRATQTVPACDSVAGSADALREAATAGARHEEQVGRPDPDWPRWHAMVDQTARP